MTRWALGTAITTNNEQQTIKQSVPRLSISTDFLQQQLSLLCPLVLCGLQASAYAMPGSLPMQACDEGVGLTTDRSCHTMVTSDEVSSGMSTACSDA